MITAQNLKNPQLKKGRNFLHGRKEKIGTKRRLSTERDENCVKVCSYLYIFDFPMYISNLLRKIR